MTSPPSTSPHLRIEGPVAHITLRNPQVQNRLCEDDLGALLAYFDQINADATVRVLLLNAEVRTTRPVFSAGYHMGEFKNAEPGGKAMFEGVIDALECVRPVTVCVLSGSVYGGSTDIPLACDIAIASDDVEMQMPAARLGLHFYGHGMRRYVSRLGLRAAQLAFLTARAFDARAMLGMGYVHEVTSRSELDLRGIEIASGIAALAPMALQSMKKSLNEIARGEADDAILADRAAQTMNSRDFLEGLAAFAEKRAPAWVGR